MIVGSVGNSGPRVRAGWGAGVEDQAGQVHHSLASWASLNGVPDTTTYRHHRHFSGPNPHSRIAIDTTTPALCRVQCISPKR